jgi:IstB-like ATP binding protein
MINPTIETLRRLRLTGMAKALEEQQNLADCDRLSFDERLAMLVDREAVERDNAALAQRLRLARCARPPVSRISITAPRAASTAA